MYPRMAILRSQNPEVPRSVWIGSRSLPLTLVNSYGVINTFREVRQSISIRRDFTGRVSSTGLGKNNLGEPCPIGLKQFITHTMRLRLDALTNLFRKSFKATGDSDLGSWSIATVSRRTQPRARPIKPGLSCGLRDIEPVGNFFHRAVFSHAGLNGLLQARREFLDRLQKSLRISGAGHTFAQDPEPSR